MAALCPARSPDAMDVFTCVISLSSDADLQKSSADGRELSAPFTLRWLLAIIYFVHIVHLLSIITISIGNNSTTRAYILQVRCVYTWAIIILLFCYPYFSRTSYQLTSHRPTPSQQNYFRRTWHYCGQG